MAGDAGDRNALDFVERNSGTADTAVNYGNDALVGPRGRLPNHIEIIEPRTVVQSAEWQVGGLREAESVFAIEAEVLLEHEIYPKYAKNAAHRRTVLAFGTIDRKVVEELAFRARDILAHIRIELVRGCSCGVQSSTQTEIRTDALRPYQNRASHHQQSQQ